MSLETLAARLREVSERADRPHARQVDPLLRRLMSYLRRTQGPFGRALAAWQEIAPDCGELARPVTLHQGVLTVDVSSSALLYELRAFRRDELLAALRADPRSRGVLELKFRLRQWPAAEPAGEE